MFCHALISLSDGARQAEEGRKEVELTDISYWELLLRTRTVKIYPVGSGYINTTVW